MTRGARRTSKKFVITNSGAAAVTACALAALAARCVSSPELGYTLDRFRVLGVRAEPPELAPGQRTELALATADVRPRAVQARWYACPGGYVPDGFPGFDAGAGVSDPVRGCLGQLPLGAGTVIDLRIPAEVATLLAGASDPRLDVVVFACAGGVVGASREGPWPSCNGADAQGWLVHVRMPLRDPSSGDPPNRNPRILGVRFGPEGAPVALEPDRPAVVARCPAGTPPRQCPRYDLAAVLSDEAYEPLPVRRGPDGGGAGGRGDGGTADGGEADGGDGGGEVAPQEVPVVGFLVDRGLLGTNDLRDFSRLPVLGGVGGVRDAGAGDGAASDAGARAFPPPVNAWWPPHEPGDVRLYVFVSDGRGGFDWTQRAIRVE